MENGKRLCLRIFACLLRAVELTNGVATHMSKSMPVHVAENATQVAMKTEVEGFVFPLSFAQQRLWFLHQLAPESPHYNLAGAFYLSGPLNIKALEESFNELIQRHETLRTVLAVVDGEPSQILIPEAKIALEPIDLNSGGGIADESAILRWMEQEARRPFILSRPPLMRVALLALGQDEHVLLVTLHHIVADAWSLTVLARELTALYTGFVSSSPSPLPDLPIQYADYAVWQKDWVESGAAAESLNFWKQRLAGDLPVLGLLTDKPRPVVQSFNGARLYFSFDGTLSHELSDLSRRAGATLFMALLAVFMTLLRRYTGHEDLIVGAPIANRNRRDLEDLIGFFVNMLPLRVDMAGATTFMELLGRVKNVTLEAYAHQDLPFEKLVEELRPTRSLEQTPLFQAVFDLHEAITKEFSLPGIKARRVDVDNGTSKFDLALSLESGTDSVSGYFEYNADIFDHTTIERWRRHWLNLLSNITSNPTLPIHSLHFLSPSELHQLLISWNQTALPLHLTGPVHQRFFLHAATQPDAIALVCGTEQIGYRELSQRAARVARFLRARGVRDEERVGVLMRRGGWLVGAVIGVMAAGGAYVGLDVGYPWERVEYIVRDAGVRLLLVDEGEERLWGGIGGVEVVGVGGGLGAGEELGAGELGVEVEWEQLAYVIYTSGSTGRPKGVAVQHASLANLVQWHQQTYGIGPSDRATLLAGLGFDASVWELWPYITAGACLYIPEEEEIRMAPARLRSWLIANRITISFVPTPLTERLIADQWPAEGTYLRALLTGGDRLERYPDRRLCFPVFNHYGPTETTVVATAGLTSAKRTVHSLPSIGRPIANTQVYALDRQLQPVPIGACGELFIAGDGLARGYLNHPALTAQRFIPNPFSSTSGARLYRSGDLVRYLPDGQLQFIGRTDGQIKLRGQRIELGEIESLLKGHPQAQEAVVVGMRGENGVVERLVGYVVRRESGEREEVKWKEYLRERLPEAMRPWVVREVEEIPLTGHGKVWREKVEEWARGEIAEGIGAGGASGREEEEMVKVWEEVLGVSGIGVHDNFFDLGGHSLLATQVISRIAMVFQVELPLRVLFEAPTVAAMAQRIEQAKGPQIVSPPLIAAADRGGTLPVSFAQQRLWFLELVQPGSSLFHMSAAMRLDGDLNIDALRHSINHVVRRHEILSAGFAVEDGQPVVVLSERPAEPPLQVVDLGPLPEVEQEAEVRRLAKQEAHTGFDLMQGPLIRTRLLRLNEKSHALLVTIHHIVADGWSMGVLTREVGALYASFVAEEPLSLPPLPIQYVDYAAWQRDILQGDFLDGLLAYWREQLSGELPVLSLPLDYTRPSVQTFDGARAPLTIPADLMDGLDALNRQMGTTLFMTLLGALQALLCRYSGQEDIITGALVANRHRLETEGLIGCFINALPIRTDLSGDPTFQQLLARVRRVSLGAYAHQDLPFEKLVDVLQPERDLSRPPIFQVMFALQNFPLDELRLPNVQLTPLPVDTDAVAYDLTFTLAEKNRALLGAIEFNTDLFAPETIERMAVHYLTLLEGAIRDPSQNISRLPLLSAAERRQLLVDWNQTAKEYPLHLRFHQVFERQVAATPEAMAVVTDQTKLSYAELNARANRMARALLAHGVGPGTVVALLSARGWELLVAIIALFKAGGAYMPLDPSYPVKRLSQIIGRSGCRLALVAAELGSQMEQALLELEEATRPQALVIEDLLDVEAPEENLARRGAPHDLAYVLFTSGSTGVPKGAMIEQCGMMNHLFAKVDDLGLTGDDTIAQNASQCFDISVWQFLAALLVGGRVRIVNDELRHDPLGLLTLVDEEKISILEVVPSLLQAMLEEVANGGAPKVRLSVLRWLIATGEALPPQLVQKWQALYPFIPMLNAYGPTECSDDVTHHPIAEALPERVTHIPIGRAIANMRMYALDKRLEPAPVGIAGELFVGGIGVGRGYLGAPERTAEVFIPDPFGGDGTRLYRTGDLVSYLPDGALKFLGRVDHQVKIRGFRIELGEIETVLRDHPLVAEALVLDHEDEHGEKLLTGYVVPRRLGDDDQSGFWSDEQVAQWQQVFESVYSQATDLPDGTLNLSGWVSSYTGEPIPEEEMRVWVETTVEHILSLKPARVLEIGCGAGLLLLRLAPHCDKYWGTDFAPRPLQYLQQQLDRHHAWSADIRLLQRAADDFADIEPDAFDAVVINSIAQYFPNVDYLARVLEGAISAVASGGFIYIGDVRNLRLLEAFHLSVQLSKAGPELRREELARRVQQAMAQEEELLLDPDFFYALKSRFPKVGQVEIHLKRGRYHNELTRFRYDVMLHIGAAEKNHADAPCLNWQADQLTIPLVERKLGESQPEILTLTQITNARLIKETRGLRWLSGAEGELHTVGEWMTAAASETSDAIAPEDLLALAERSFYDIVISGGRSGPEGYFDAVLTRKGSTWERAKNPGLAGLEPPADAPVKPWSKYSNNPLQGVVSAKLLPQLRAFLKEKLPDYMVPAVFIVLESLPLTANGKVDRRALPKPHASPLKHEGTYVEARTPMERTVTRIWRQVLGLHRIGIHEKFFDIGGDSLKIVRVFRLLQEAYPGALTVVDLFKHSSIEAISAFLDAASQTMEAAPELQGVEL